MTDFSLIPKSLRSLSEFGQTYTRSHPGVRPHEIERKYLKALDVFFGAKGSKRAAEGPPEDEREGTGVGAGVKMTGRVRKTFGANAVVFTAPFERSDFVPIAAAVSAGAAGAVAGGSGSTGQTITVNKIAECALPEWMIEVINLAPKVKDNLEVDYNLREKVYIFGVCGVNESQFSTMVRRFVHAAHPFLSKFYPKELNFRILGNVAPPSTYHYGGENGIPGQPGYDGYWAHAEKDAKEFRDFINNEHCLVSGIGWRLHARLILKNPFDRKLYILDPHGVFGSWFDRSQPKSPERIQDETLVQRINRVVFKPRAKTSGYTECQLLDRTKVDQGSEGSCAAQSFLRGVYILYKAHLNPGRSLLDFVNDDIPCVFAVFVSKLFQRAKIITHETLQQSRASAHADDRRVEEHKAALRQIEEEHAARMAEIDRQSEERMARIAALSERDFLAEIDQRHAPRAASGSETIRYAPGSNSGGRSMSPGAGFGITNQVSMISNALVHVPIDAAFAFAGIHPGSSFEVHPSSPAGPVQVENLEMTADGTVRIEIPETQRAKLWKAYKDNYENVIFEIPFSMEFLRKAASTPELRKYLMEPYDVRVITDGAKQFVV